MTREEIFRKLKTIFRYTVGDDEAVLQSITENSDLYTDLGLTSVGMLYIVIAAEEMFGIRFEDVQFGDFKTVGDVIDYILRKTA